MIMKKIMVCSGKGGVGKTTISVALAKSLSMSGKKVALVDCDIDTPNIPDFMNIKQEVGVGESIKPIVRDNIEMISIGFIIKESDFVSWPSQRRGMAVQQLIDTIDWSDNIDYMVIDTPPGTSDEIEYVSMSLKPDYIFIISTPHDASISDVKRTISMLDSCGVEITGIVMNMVTIVCPDCGKEIYNPNVPESINDVPVILSIDYSHNINIEPLTDIIVGD